MRIALAGTIVAVFAAALGAGGVSTARETSRAEVSDGSNIKSIPSLLALEDAYVGAKLPPLSLPSARDLGASKFGRAGPPAQHADPGPDVGLEFCEGGGPCVSVCNLLVAPTPLFTGPRACVRDPNNQGCLRFAVLRPGKEPCLNEGAPHQATHRGRAGP